MKTCYFRPNIGRLLTAVLMLACGPTCWERNSAHATDVASAPIFTTAVATTEVKPNVMFVLDDSGSMAWTYMPDTVQTFFKDSNGVYEYGYRSSQCNGVYYNPAITYIAPVNAVGVSMGNATFTAAQYDGFNTATGTLSTSTGKGTVDLSSQFRADMLVPYSENANNAGLQDPAQAAYYYVYSGTQTTENLRNYYNSNSVFYKECNSTIGSTSMVDGTHAVNTLFTKKTVSATSGPGGTDERTNFANWFTYYRTRMQMMKTATGQAFKPIGYQPWNTDLSAAERVKSHFRVGFMTINGNSTAEFLNIGDFDSTQKTTWYSKLYAISPNSSTPLREALAYAGQIYAGKQPSAYTTNGITITNPVQYSCQQNYSILSTDGFWNGTDSKVKKLDLTTTMGNEDGALPRPYFDGASITSNKSTSQLQSSKARLSESTSQSQMRTTQIQAATTQVQRRTIQNQSSTTQTQMRTVQYQSSTTKIQMRTVQFQKCKADQSSCRDTSDCTGGTGDAARPYCSIKQDTGFVDKSSCTASNPPSGPTVTCQPSAAVLANVGTCTASVKNGLTVTCQTASDSGWGNVSSCTASNPSSGPTVTCQPSAAVLANVGTCTASVSNGQTVTCQTGSDSGWSNVSSCAASNPSVGPTVTCQTTDSGWQSASTCAASGPTNGQTVTCQLSDTGWLGAGSCAASSSAGQTVACQTIPTGPTPVASCTNQTANSGNAWLQRTCTSAVIAAPTGVASCTPDAPTSVNGYVATNCNTVTTGPTSTTSCSAEGASASNNYTATACSVISSTGGTSNTLADVAAYYYNTNLRTNVLNNCSGVGANSEVTDLCTANKVPPNGLDTATWQHMTTFTLGLGARGRMVFSPTYLSDTSGDYYNVWKGNTATTTQCTWATVGTTCNWPTPSADHPENIDDLWHAAVNGHGNYFSATDPASLKNALSSSLNVIINTPQPGTAAAAATTNPKITSTNNFQFSSYFKSLEWSGELIKQTMSLTDGSVAAYDPLNPNPSSYVWSAQSLLDVKTYTTRNIYINGGSGLIPFTWAGMNSTLQANFKTAAISTTPPGYPTQLTGLSQFCATAGSCLSATAQTNFTIASGGAAGEALVNFLRGDRSNEEGAVTDATKYYRNRTHVLGDIVSAQPQYGGAPSKSYSDSGYDAFRSAQASRTSLVFAAANDGMLHAFDADTGDEKWAFIPSYLLPKLYTLADKNYSSKHQYFVEGTPKISDAYIGGAWKTILIGGLSGGGVGYYALDITNPTTPVLLWEITHANMGYSFGNPEITKLDNGTWVVLVTSGYNNCARGSASCVTASGNGNGYLYVLNAATGVIIQSISTGVGGSSGLSRILAQGNSNNVSKRVYGGDLLGNMWRFNIETSGTGSNTATLIATLKDAVGNPQAITARPQVTTLDGISIVFVGTGRYLGTTDVGQTQQQSFYGIKDNVTSTAYTGIRTDSTFIKKTAVNGICPAGTLVDICDPGTQVRTVSLNTGTTSTDSITTKNGWYVDFPAGSGELEFTDPKLVLGTLAFSTSVPVSSTSAVCGNPTYAELPAFAYTLDYLSGGAIGNTGVIASTLGVGIATSPQTAQLPDGTIIQKYRLSSGQEIAKKNRTNPSAGTNRTRRVSWREMVTQ